MKTIWCTDIHLDHVIGDGPVIFGKFLLNEHPNAQIVVITGDIAEEPTFAKAIDRFANTVNIPVYFVLGNHDAYRGSIKSSRLKAAKTKVAKWLTNEDYVPLEDTALVGQDGFYDARLGLGAYSKFILNDFLKIKELRKASNPKLLNWNPSMSMSDISDSNFLEYMEPIVKMAASIADAEVEQARTKLENTINYGYKEIVFATHVPPFYQSSWYYNEETGEPTMASSNSLPWYSCKSMGDMLLYIAESNPTVDITVIAGHTHCKCEYQALPNLKVLVGSARYKFPSIAGVFDL